ncbi:MAG TPA: hypothetical protein VH482_02840 [Thermomicrobiales bacterium]
MAKRDLRARKIDGDVQAAIEELALQGWGGTQIRTELSRREQFGGRLPTVRTVQSIVREIAPRDGSGEWSPLKADPESAALALDALAAVVESSEGRIRSLTVAEAERISALRTMRPDLPPWDAWFLARTYLAREPHGDPVDDLDAYLAFAPWRDDESFERYLSATDAGWVTSSPMVLLHHFIQRRGGAVARTEDGEVLGVVADTAQQWAERPAWLRRRSKGQEG